MKITKKSSKTGILDLAEPKEMGRHDSASKDRLGSQASGELKTPTAE